jgi:hypothetical protein
MVPAVSLNVPRMALPIICQTIEDLRASNLYFVTCEAVHGIFSNEYATFDGLRVLSQPGTISSQLG